MEEGEAGKVDSGILFSLPFLSPELRGARGLVWTGKRGSSCRAPGERIGAEVLLRRGCRADKSPPDSGGDTKLSGDRIQQNAIKDEFFIVLSCRQLGKVLSSQHK